VSDDGNFDSIAAVAQIFMLWPPCVAGADIVFLSCGFFFLLSSSSSIFFLAYSEPSQIGCLPYFTQCHGVALVRIWDAGPKRAARGSLTYRTQKIAKNSLSTHHCTTLSGYIVATNKARIDNLKNMLNSNISPPSLQYPELRPTSG